MPLPNTITTTDTFFKDNNYANFLLWMKDIQTSLLALNQYNPQSSFTATDSSDPKILIQFLETTAIAEAIQLVNQSFITQQDKDITNTQDQAKNSIVGDNQVRTNQITTELKNRDKTADTVNNPVPKDLRINENPNDSGYTRSYQTTDATGAPVVHTPAFPQVGQAYDNHMAEITNRLINLDTFEIFTGYKPKGQGTTTNPDYDFKSWVIPKGTNKANWVSDPKRTFTPDRPFADYINEVIKKTNATPYPGAYKFFIEKLHGRYSDGTPYKMNGLKSQKDVSGTGLTNLSNRMVFFAYVENYADSYNASWSDYNFIGRAEQVPAYKSTKRDITLEFLILTDYNAELMVAMEQLSNIVNQSTEDDVLTNLIKGNNIDWGLGLLTPPTLTTAGNQIGNVPGLYSDTPEGLWSKMTFLSQCVYPYYRDDGKMKDQPLIRLRIADFYDVVVYINSLQMSMNAFDGPMVDMNPSSIGNMPFGVRVTMSATILHNHEPSSTYYGFYNRREFDTGALDPATGVGINLQKNKMQLGATKNSPTEFFNTAINDKNLDTSKVDLTSLSKNLTNFTSSFGNLKSVGTTLLTSYMKQQTKASIEAFRAVSEIANYLQVLNGVSSTGINSTSDLVKANTVTPKPNADTSLDGTTGGKLATAQQSNQEFKDAFNTTSVQPNSQLLNPPSIHTNSSDPTITNDLQKIGGNVFTQTEADKITNTAKAESQSFAPKTIQDIIDFAKSKTS